MMANFANHAKACRASVARSFTEHSPISAAARQAKDASADARQEQARWLRNGARVKAYLLKSDLLSGGKL
jgi:hypothetical protein